MKFKSPDPRLLTAALSYLLLTGAQAVQKHEIWLLDQTNTYDSDGNGTLDSGGHLYLYNGDDFAGTGVPNPVPQKIDLGGTIATNVKTTTGEAPVRPHYISFNPTGTHAVITFVATGHVLIIEAATRNVVYSVDVGVQAHAANVSPTNDYILVANQNGKLVQRIDANFGTNTFALDSTATLDLANGVTPTGAPRQGTERPDNAAVITYPDQRDGNLAFITLRGGGGFVVNPRSTPIEIVGEFSKDTIEPAGLIAVQKGPKLYFNSGGGGASTLGHQGVLYTLDWDAFSPAPATPKPADTPTPTVVFDFGALPPGAATETRSSPVTDSHGIQFSKPNADYLWAVDRADNKIIVVNPTTDQIVNRINLVSRATGDPTPDLVRFSPDGTRAYASLRGPVPLSGNNATVNNAKGSTPGLGIFHVTDNGLNAKLQHVIRTSFRNAAGAEVSDPHGIHVRTFEVP
ncbi:hypothetical protein JIN84_18990 [Luteolibacter yonseiensis]|uniref:Uncharacterized protein n=1 Tax=Luteolibacter yonseiensis TaxID=1144680 RepID=A0A934R3H4_9BACT|nr:hypothetical protein [Luteolibacter yonseiensis]MBK1817713.1 hypothetical protein [Luteolibacter yonseiensis]